MNDYGTHRVPPTQPAIPIAATQRAAWPTVFGILLIVMGSFGIMGGCMGAFSGMVFDFLDDEMPTEWLTSWMWFVILSSIAGFALGGLALASGIGIVRRVRWGMTAGIIWAIAKIVYELAIIVPSIQMQHEQFAAMREIDSQPPGVEAMMRFMATGSVVVGLLFGIALPVLLLIWRARPSTKQEMDTWGHTQGV